MGDAPGKDWGPVGFKVLSNSNQSVVLRLTLFYHSAHRSQCQAGKRALTSPGSVLLKYDAGF